MSEKVEAKNNGVSNGGHNKLAPGIDSNFRLIVVAGLRSKQLLRGSQPRIEVDPKRRRNTSIAVEEVKRGLVPFRLVSPDQTNGVRSAELIERPWINARL